MFGHVIKQYIALSTSISIMQSKKTQPLGLKFKASSPIVISGPTGAGKTVWTHKLLSNNMFSEKPASVVYCYGAYQKVFDTFHQDIPNIQFHSGLPTSEFIEGMKDGNFHVLVLDDLMEEVVHGGIEVMNLFTRLCHHYNITAIFVTQNIFAQGKYARSIALNTHYLVLFENKRDESQMLHLARQVTPHDTKYFLESYADAVSSLHGYLLVDCEPTSNKDLQLRTSIFPTEVMTVYLKRN